MGAVQWQRVMNGHYRATLNGRLVDLVRLNGREAWWSVFVDSKQVTYASTLASAKRRAAQKVETLKENK